MSKAIGCIIMASGISKRFGRNKLLEDFHGSSLFEHALDLVQGVGFDKKLILTRTAELIDHCQDDQVQIICHDLPDRNEAIALGIEHMLEMDACLFCPCDQPLLTRDSLLRMTEAFEEHGDGIYRLSWEGEAGSPVLFSKKYYQELMTLPAKRGGSYLADIHPEEVICVEACSNLELLDVDTPEDLANIKNIWTKGRIRP